MSSVPPLRSFLLMVVSGWVYRHQLIVIDFLQTENRLLKERLHGKRIRFTDAERALLAKKVKAVGRNVLLKRLDGPSGHTANVTTPLKRKKVETHRYPQPRHPGSHYRGDVQAP